MLKEQWGKLNPKKQRLLAASGAAVFLVGAVAVFSDKPADIDGGKKQRRAGETVRHILTDRDSRELTFESLADQLQASQRQNDNLEDQISSLRREIAVVGASGVPAEVSNEIDSLGRELDLIREENQQLRQKQDAASGGDVTVINPRRDNHDNPEQVSSPDSGDSAQEDSEDNPGDQGGDRRNVDRSNPNFQGSVDVDDVFKRSPTPRRQPQQGDDGEEAQNRGLQITSYYEQRSEEAEMADEEEVDVPYLPAGTIVSGVLLNGMDAPTSQGSRRDPFPSTIRIKHEAILPNRYSADIQECFLIVSGYGDLSAERAYLRGETLSCVTEDEEIIETSMEGYAVGDDGKSGIRGRLVSKQGAIIARSMVAGFFSGAASAFDVSPVPFIETGSSSDRGGDRYQSDFSPELVEGAAASGASQALDRVAEFYVDMAESIYPVIEINAGRKVDVILTSGSELTIRGKK